MGGERPPPYRAYVLRCWQEQPGGVSEESSWRFSLEEVVQERRRRGFSDLDAVVSFLRAELVDAERRRGRESDALRPR